MEIEKDLGWMEIGICSWWMRDGTFYGERQVLGGLASISVDV